MVKDLDGKWGLILGGSSGIGLACAKKLLSHGMNLFLVHRSFRKVEQSLIQELTNHAQIADADKPFETDQKNHLPKVYPINADATHAGKRSQSIQTIKRVLSQHDSRLYLFLHAIAKGNLKPMIGKHSLTEDDYSQTINSMGVSLALWAKEIHASHLFSSSARIVSLTSEGSQRPVKNYAAVAAAKATLEALTRQLAIELAPDRISANCLQPGVTDTTSLNAIPGADDLKKMATMRNPAKRLSLPEDTANALYLLCKDEASWINGNIITVDGGENLQ